MSPPSTTATMSFLYYRDDGDLMLPWAYTAAAVTLFLIGFFGFFLNLFVIALMCKDVQVS
jgi:c-opsin